MIPSPLGPTPLAAPLPQIIPHPPLDVLAAGEFFHEAWVGEAGEVGGGGALAEGLEGGVGGLDGGHDGLVALKGDADAACGEVVEV